jgi:hypothetical protein
MTWSGPLIQRSISALFNDGYDIVVDFDPKKGDTSADNCEVALTHNSNDIHVFCDDILTSS